MYWRGARFMRYVFSRRWRNTADSATLAHAIHKRRMRQRAMRIFGGIESISVRDATRNSLPVMIVGGTGQRVFPELGDLTGIIGKFIGEIAHTYNATWEWTGFVWRQRF